MKWLGEHGRVFENWCPHFTWSPPNAVKTSFEFLKFVQIDPVKFPAIFFILSLFLALVLCNGVFYDTNIEPG